MLEMERKECSAEKERTGKHKMSLNHYAITTEILFGYKK